MASNAGRVASESIRKNSAVIKEDQLRIAPEIAGEPDLLRQYVSQKEGIPPGEIRHIEVLKRSIDARQKNVTINLKVKIYINEPYQPEPIELPHYPDVSSAEEVLIVGMGPAGLFAARQLATEGAHVLLFNRDVKPGGLAEYPKTSLIGRAPAVP
jgi:uncharacterized protein